MLDVVTELCRNLVKVIECVGMPPAWRRLM